MRALTACVVLGALALASAANAQFANPGFESGNLNGWTLGFTANGATAIQDTETIDVDGPGPLGLSPAARFSVGRASATGAASGGIELTQSLALTGGTQYTIDFDWAALRTISTTNAEGGVFELIVDGTALAQAAAGSTSSSAPHYGHLSANFTPGANGNYAVGVRITRPYTIPSPTAPTLFQYVDNMSIVPAPSTIALLGLGGLLGARRRR